MKAPYLMDIETPKKYLLQGLWYGREKPTTVYIWVHGLTGSIFSGRRIINLLAKGNDAGITFNTRGAGHVNDVKRKQGTKMIYETAGTAYEKFQDCVDDVQGVMNFARKKGAKKIFLLGHSTGCQKSVYWASKGGRGVNGLILLGPLSDFADTLVPNKRAHYRAGLALAKKLVRSGRGLELMPKKYTEWLFLTAARYVSLYTPDSVEEIFTYAQVKRKPKTLQKVKTPILAVLAERDEFADRPAKEIESWFLEHIYEGEVHVVPDVGHGFKGAEDALAKKIRTWVASLV